MRKPQPSMNPQTMSQGELEAMALLSTQFRPEWQPHLAEIALAAELAAFMEPAPTGGDLDKEVEACARLLVKIKEE